LVSFKDTDTRKEVNNVNDSSVVRKCPRCGKPMQVNKAKGQADKLVKTWGFEPFEHTDYDCFECGVHMTEREGVVLTGFILKKKEVNNVEKV